MRPQHHTAHAVCYILKQETICLIISQLLNSYFTKIVTIYATFSGIYVRKVNRFISHIKASSREHNSIKNTKIK